LPFKELLGFGTYATSEQLQEKFGKETTVISIGQGGEYLMRGASIVVTGEGDQRSNIAARGGLGAVMGSKGLKAIVIDKPKKETQILPMLTFSDLRLVRLPKN
jgi:aldehyde:ferredoxin oxidoreductase